MTAVRKSIAGALLYLVAATAPRVAAFVLLPIYAVELSPKELAAYGIVVSLAQFIGIISDAGVVNALVRTYYDYTDGEEQEAYLNSTAIYSRIVAAFNLVWIGGLLALAWNVFFQGSLSMAVGLPIVIAFAYMQRGNTLAGIYYRLKKDHRMFMMTKVTPATVQAVVGITLVFGAHWGVTGAILAAPIGFLTSIAMTVFGNRAHASRTSWLTRAQMRRLFAVGIPLITDELARWAQLLSLRPLLALFVSLREVATFTFSNAPAQIVAPLSEAVELYLAPIYYEACRNNDPQQLRMVRQAGSLFIGFGSIVVILCVNLFDPLFLHLAPAPYRAAGGIAAISVAGMVIREQLALMVHNLRQEEKTHVVVVAVTCGIAVSYGQFFLLVSMFHNWAAAWAIYLYPLVACVVALIGLRGTHMYFLKREHVLVANGAVLATVAVYLTRYMPAVGAGVTQIAVPLVSLAAVAIIFFQTSLGDVVALIGGAGGLKRRRAG